MSKIFLDSSLLFPLFRLESEIDIIEKEFPRILDDFSNTYFYSIVSLIEIKWQYIKLEKQNKDEQYIEVIRENYTRYLDGFLKDDFFTEVAYPDVIINRISDTIRSEGHRDLFDTVITASAIWFGDYFITEDKWLLNNIPAINKKFNYNNNFQVISANQFFNELIG